MRLDDEAVRVAVSMRLGLSLCIPHECRCGTLVDARVLHAMLRKKAPGKHARHHVLNEHVYSQKCRNREWKRKDRWTDMYTALKP